jgi:hypothetical protein
VGGIKKPSPSGTTQKQVPRLGLKSSLGMTKVRMKEKRTI